MVPAAATGDCEQQALGQQLPHQTRRVAPIDARSARSRARALLFDEHEIGDVRAREQEHQANQHQDHQRSVRAAGVESGARRDLGDHHGRSSSIRVWMGALQIAGEHSELAARLGGGDPGVQGVPGPSTSGPCGLSTHRVASAGYTLRIAERGTKMSGWKYNSVPANRSGVTPTIVNDAPEKRISATDNVWRFLEITVPDAVTDHGDSRSHRHRPGGRNPRPIVRLDAEHREEVGTDNPAAEVSRRFLPDLIASAKSPVS